MTKQPFTPADERVESVLWPDGPRCPRCPDSRRFVRDKSRDGRWHRCLSCYVCASSTAGTFLHGVRTPLHIVLRGFEIIENEPAITISALARALHTTPTISKNLLLLWKANRATPVGRRLATLFDTIPPAKVPLLHPSHPLHGLL